MGADGTELLVGVTVDATFGPVLAIGLGGVWVEIMGDTSLRVLPVDTAEVKRMLGELRGLPLLQGARGTRAADLDALADVIAGISRVALSLAKRRPPKRAADPPPCPRSSAARAGGTGPWVRAGHR